ncbi:MAG: extracellular solute-binding protein [Clostridia bacterium]|nr:extracellular solute-binding protein [Clostridia bacterium]
MKRNFGFKPYEGNGKYGFISYKSEDEKLVAPYAKALHDKSVKLWYDYGIPVGEDWFQTISQKIVESSFVILFVTERIFHSSVIQTEIQTAEMWRIPVIPVFLEQIDINHIPKKQASLLAKLYLKQGVDRVWNMTAEDTADSVYELIMPVLVSDTEERIQQRGELLEHQTSLNPNVNASPMVQSALSEAKADVAEVSFQTIAKGDTRHSVNSNRNHSKRKWIMLVPAVVIVLLAGGFGAAFLFTDAFGFLFGTVSDSDQTNDSDKGITLWIGVDENYQDFIEKAANTFCRKYMEEHDEIDSLRVKIKTVKESDEDYTQSDMPDIFNMPRDRLSNNFLSYRSIYAIPDVTAEEMKSTLGNVMESVRIGDNYYGVPYDPFLAHLFVYNTNIYSESEARDLNAILAKGKIGIEKSGFAEITWLFTAGGRFFPNDDASVCTLDSSECMEMIRFVHENQSNIVRADASELVTLFKDMEISAIFLPAWEYGNLIDRVGNGYKVTVLPNVTVNNNTYAMRCFSTMKLFVINSSCQYPEIAVALLQYLVSEDVQLAWYLAGKPTLVNPALLSRSEIQSDDYVYVTLAQQSNVEYIGGLDYMAWWENADNLLNKIYDGTVTQEDMTNLVEQCKIRAVN